jgi:hypothetical protein
MEMFHTNTIVVRTAFCNMKAQTEVSKITQNES